MKILFVISNLYVKGNGMSVSARRTIKELRLAGQEVRVLSGANPEPNGPEPEYKLELFKFPIFQPIIDHNGFCFARSYTKKDLQVMEEAIRWADVVQGRPDSQTAGQTHHRHLSHPSGEYPLSDRHSKPSYQQTDAEILEATRL